jgi:MoaA/NifB/PqqE/SkfB family radical SAM enzyme
MPPSSGFAPLDCDPTAEELVAAVTAWPGYFSAVCFAGVGEPLLRRPVVTEASRLIKAAMPSIGSMRLNTNGLFAEPEEVVQDLMDSGITACSVALNFADAKAYNQIMLQPPQYDARYHTDCIGDVSDIGEDGFHLAVNFIRASAMAGIDTTVTCVEHESTNLSAVEELAKELGASSFKQRSYNPLLTTSTL